jgi:hypothetical protein
MGGRWPIFASALSRAHICAGTFRLERIFRPSKQAEAIPPGMIGGLRPTVRQARPEEYPALRKIEFEADQLFASVGIGPCTNDGAEDHFLRRL